MSLPADSHVHSEWSWDAPKGSMERSCARAMAFGLPAIAFTEHVDHTVWTVALDALDPDDHLATLSTPDGQLTPPAFDAPGYLEAIERCRERFPGLRILSGLEVGEPHWHARAVTDVLGTGRFDRVLGSLHCLPTGDGAFSEPPGLYGRRAAAEVVRAYLAEVPRLVTGSDVFSVLAHIDYPIRYWPHREAGPFDLLAFEEEFRHALRVTARSGRALEINTRVPMGSTLLKWWRAEGGQAVTFGSDAHDPSLVAHGFREAADMAEAHGFRPGQEPYDFWARVG
ncbi:PHP domain-containing protein [Nonomuraea sp. PA05]|uniref:PHP domain-containing protein n=1 Tax=Nonomuraea sp. PA05 TaxID=2604466 RepID=UPI0011D7F3E8|nr:PHP domain-containing protein [Nonomuraea sp. PA05]TYB62634.1 PHP domain-containing protein [Nonomuraea sp. PA05]